jgi:energy-coupling factor transporter transmembrane protein EcfT
VDPRHAHATQIPQYFLLGCGEIMVSITGLEFAYSQAPQSMKSVVMAGWLLTTAVGNAIVAVIAESKIFSERWLEFFFFAGLMVVFIIIFIGFTFNYRYVEDVAAVESSNDDVGGLAGLGGQTDDGYTSSGKRKSSKKDERRRLMRDDRFDEGIVIDHEEDGAHPATLRNTGGKRDGYDQVDTI